MLHSVQSFFENFLSKLVYKQPRYNCYQLVYWPNLAQTFSKLDDSSFCYYERPAPFPDQHKATMFLLLHGFTANNPFMLVHLPHCPTNR